MPCRDFQEEEGSQRPASAASYRVRCKLDGRSYVALFATSEVDQTSHNVWTEEAAWLERIPGVQQILALAVDAVTENIFFLLPDGERPLSELLGEESGAGGGSAPGPGTRDAAGPSRGRSPSHAPDLGLANI